MSSIMIHSSSSATSSILADRLSGRESPESAGPPLEGDADPDVGSDFFDFLLSLLDFFLSLLDSDFFFFPFFLGMSHSQRGINDSTYAYSQTVS